MRRRDFVSGLTFAAAAGAGAWPAPAAAEPAPETTTLRLVETRGICFAPLHMAESLLADEGFTDVRYAKTAGRTGQALALGEADITIDFVGPLLLGLDRGVPTLIVAGGHVGCHELFATPRIRDIRDLTGKTVAAPSTGSGQYVFLVSMLQHAGLDHRKDVNWAFHPARESSQLLADGKIDAFLSFPPEAQELRAQGTGHVLLDTTTMRPWSEHFCCMIAANRDFVRRSPVAAKRALRAIVKGTDLCAAEPGRAAQLLVARGFATRHELALQVMKEIPYGKWRDYDPEDTVRFYALRLREAGMIKSSPQKIIAQGTDWRFINELKKELKG